MSDIPTGLTFVDPDEVDPTWRVCLWAAPGEGKSVAAASAPTPIVVLSADRPSAYLFARKHHGLSKDDLREVRYRDLDTLVEVYRYIRDNPEVRTLIIDPFVNVVDAVVDDAPLKPDGDPNYQWSNKKLLDFVKSLREFDINVVLVTHERLNDGKKGDGKMYPALGGPTLINKLLGEMDICAHIESRTTGEDGERQWFGQIQPVNNLVCKDGTNALGERRIANLTRWFEVATESTKPDDSDLPFAARDDEPEPQDGDPKPEPVSVEDEPQLPAAA